MVVIPFMKLAVIFVRSLGSVLLLLLLLLHFAAIAVLVNGLRVCALIMMST